MASGRPNACTATPSLQKNGAPSGNSCSSRAKSAAPTCTRCCCQKAYPINLAGIVTTWQFDDFMYIGAPATMPDMRGNGIGANVVNSPRSGPGTHAGARSRASVGRQSYGRTATWLLQATRLRGNRRELHIPAAIRPRKPHPCPAAALRHSRTRPRRGDMYAALAGLRSQFLRPYIRLLYSGID